MRILVIGGDGMLGHQVVAGLADRHEVACTLRRELDDYGPLPSEGATRYGGIDVGRPDPVAAVLAAFRPEGIVNAAGIVKQRADAARSIPSIEVNALFPHRLGAMAADVGARLVHVSTDCVFSGRQGDYRETDNPDPVDLYGRSKLLGEVDEPGCVTLRTSIVGLELANPLGLVEWALAQSGTVPGYRRVLYNGLTTPELTRVIERVLATAPDLRGVWHVASQPISKYDLLTLLYDKVGRTDVELVPQDEPVSDRTLCAEAFQNAVGYLPAAWDGMLDELAALVRHRQRT